LAVLAESGKAGAGLFVHDVCGHVRVRWIRLRMHRMGNKASCSRLSRRQLQLATIGLPVYSLGMTSNKSTSVGSFFPDQLPHFQIGQLVCHRQYSYRGVVVDFDMRCMAGDDWYRSNRTHPDPSQPWYHVLVDGSTATTYAAQKNLDLDIGHKPVAHPLLEHFFESFADGQYKRNDRQWLSWR